MKRKHIPADPCRDRSRRKQEALAFLASRGITQIRAAYPAARHVGAEVLKIRANIAVVRRLTLAS